MSTKQYDYDKDGHIWGDRPSVSVEDAITIFKNNKVNKLHIVAAGYGRNVLPFVDAEFSVTASDLVDSAISCLKQIEGVCPLKYDTFTKSPFKYDGIYAFSLLHLFSETKRLEIMDNLVDSLTDNGVLIIVNSSEDNNVTRQDKEFIASSEIDKYQELFNLTLLEKIEYSDHLDYQDKSVDYKCTLYALKKSLNKI